MSSNLLLDSMVEFFNSTSTKFSVLDIQNTYFINSYLDNLWQGSTGKINWSCVSGHRSLKEFPSEMDTEKVTNIFLNQKYAAFDSEKVALYFSGSEQCIELDSHLFINSLFTFMNDFCFLDSVLLFDSISVRSGMDNINFVELRFFEYVCGQVVA